MNTGESISFISADEEFCVMLSIAVVIFGLLLIFLVVFGSRTFLSIIAGCATGVMGFTGLSGLLCFLVVSLCVSAGFAYKAGPHPETYLQSVSGMFLSGLTGGIGSFILFWTMAFDIVHIYG